MSASSVGPIIDCLSGAAYSVAQGTWRLAQGGFNRYEETVNSAIDRVCGAAYAAFESIQLFFSNLADQAPKAYLIFCVEFDPEATICEKITLYVQNLFTLIQSLFSACFYGCKDTLNDVCYTEGANGIMAIQALSLFGPDVNEPGIDRRLPLLTATLASNKAAIDTLVGRCSARLGNGYELDEHGVNISVSVNEHGDSAFLIAAKLGDLDLVRHFVENYPGVISLRNALGQNAFHIAVFLQYFEIVDYLRERCPELINTQDNKGFTPLHHTVQLVRRDMVVRTVGSGVVATVLNEVIQAFNLLAPIHRNWVENLLEDENLAQLFGHLQAEIENLDYGIRAQIEGAFSERDCEALEGLIAHLPAGRRTKIKSFFTLATIADLLTELNASASCLSIQDRNMIKELFSSEARSYRRERLEAGAEYLRKEHQVMVQSLTTAGARRDLFLTLRRVISNLPVGQRGDFQDLFEERAEALLTEMRETVASLAESQRRLAENLIAEGAGRSPGGDMLLSRFGESAVHLSIKEGNPDLTIYLAGQFPESICRSDDTGCQPLHHCLDWGNYAANGFAHADFDTFYSLVPYVIQNEGVEALESKDRFGYPVLYKMVRSGNLYGAQFLAGADFSYALGVIAWNESLMHLAVLHTVNMVDYLSQRGAPLDQADDSGQAPFYLACLRAFGSPGELFEDAHAMPILNFLRDSGGVDLNRRNEIGYSALYKMLEVGSSDGVQYLVEAGASVAGEQGPHAETLMHMAVRNANLETVTLLKDQGAPLDEPDDKGRTPLYYAALRAFTNPEAAEEDPEARQIVDLLLTEFVDPDHLDEGGYPILYRLLMKGASREGVECFVAAGATLDLQFPEDKTLMHAAAKKCGSDTVGYLIEELARVGEALLDQEDEDGFPPMYYAAVRAFTQPRAAEEDPEARNVVEQLMPRVDLDHLYGNGRTLLSLLMQKNASLDGIQLLVQGGASLNIVLPDDDTLVHVAAEKCGLDMVQYLVARGLDLDEMNNSHQTPLYFAAKRAFSTVEAPGQETLELIDYFLRENANKARAATALRRHVGSSSAERLLTYVPG